MRTRELPPDEWGRLPVECDIPLALPYHDPHDVRIVVVEDGDQIVGTWAVLRVVQLEGLWIAPDYRHGVGVARRLLAATFALARRIAPATFWAYSSAETPDVARLLTKHVGALKLPYDAYVVPMKDLPATTTPRRSGGAF